MLNEERIRRMTKLAVYDQEDDQRDERITRYFQGDYIFSRLVGSFVAGTAAYVLLLLVYCFYNMEQVTMHLYSAHFTGILVTCVAIYVIFISAFLLLTYFIYRRRYEAAARRRRQYRRALRALEQSFNEDEQT